MKLLHRVKVREVHITYNSNFTAVTKFLLSLVIGTVTGSIHMPKLQLDINKFF